MALTLEAPATLQDDEAIAGRIGDEQTEQSGSDSSEGNDEATSSEPSEESDPLPEHDDEFWRELEIIGEIAQAERDCQQCQVEFDDLTQQRKETKEELDAAVIRLRQATSKLVEQIDDRELPEKPSEPADEPTATDNNWQDTTTSELLDGVKGLGAKKLEAIAELAPTAGKLEELRGEASKQCKSFREVLPKGCGQTIADAIEDRLIEHVTKAGPSVAEQIEQREREELAQATAEPRDDDKYEDVE